MMRAALFAAVLSPMMLGTGACATATVAPEIPDDGPALPSATEDTCGARVLRDLIGRPASSSAVPPEGPGVRHLRPDTMATMDLRRDRLNVMIDKDGVIYALRCY
jgi:hypothetical protein